MEKKNETKKIIPQELLIVAYQNGVFPMGEKNNDIINWYFPNPRAILPLKNFKISRSLKQVLKKNKFQIKINSSFNEVIKNCADRKETWVSQIIIDSYISLYKNGFAHSVETWENGNLVGALYGVAIGSAFFGESMYSKVSNASKIALYYLVERLKEKKFTLLEIQFLTEHLKKFGGIEIDSESYLTILKNAVRKKRKFI